MMKNPINLLWLMVILLLSSCQKNQENPASIVANGSKKVLQDLQKLPMPVLFASIKLDDHGALAKGFLIDRAAHLRAIQGAPARYLKFDDGFISEHHLRNLILRSAFVKTLDPLEVMLHWENGKNLKKTDTNAEIPLEYGELQFHFSLNKVNHIPENCGPGNWDRGPTFHKTIVASHGIQSNINDSDIGLDLSIWLETFESAVKNY